MVRGKILYTFDDQEIVNAVTIWRKRLVYCNRVAGWVNYLYVHHYVGRSVIKTITGLFKSYRRSTNPYGLQGLAYNFYYRWVCRNNAHRQTGGLIYAARQHHAAV